jgi:hypothetical protein
MKGMGLGEALQLLSVVLAALAALSGYLGTKLGDHGYLNTFKRSPPRSGSPALALPADCLEGHSDRRGGPGAQQFTSSSRATTSECRSWRASRPTSRPTPTVNYPTTVSGRASIVDQLLLEDATYYISVAHPSIRWKASVLGWVDRRGRDQ